MKEVERWLEKAEKDLETAKFNFKGKALKALFLKKSKRIRKIHDLVILGRNVNLPEKFISLCKELSPAYVYTRYPEIPEVKDIKGTSKKFIEYAEMVIEWIKKQL